MKKVIIRKKDFNCLFCLLILLVTGVFFTTSDQLGYVTLPIAIVSFVILFCYAIRDKEEHIFLLCFLISFFTFLLGGQILNRIFKVYYYNFSNAIEYHADFSLLISIVGIAFGYILLGHTNDSHNAQVSSYAYFEERQCLSIRKMSKYLYIAVYGFWILTVLDVIFFVRRHGYISYYISFKSSLPSIVRQIGYFGPTSLFIFLATLPSKDEAKWPLFSYALYAFLSLFTGRRINFIVSLLFIFAYMLCRNKVKPGNSKWLSTRALVVVLVSIPLLMIAMYLFEYLRADIYVGNSTDYSPILGFFVRQGTSINVIKFTELYKDQLDPNAHYSFYNFLRWIYNTPFKALLGNTYVFGSQSAETAMHGTYLADFVSYYSMRSAYLSGQGYGSCYIEELFVDYGYCGVFFGNLIYGFVFRKLTNAMGSISSVWKAATGLYMLNYLFQAPRSTFDAFFAHLLYPEFWLPVMAVYFSAQLITRRYNKYFSRSRITDI